MQDSSIPAKFPTPFAGSAGVGFIRNIPQASQIGIQNGAASMVDGFPPNCFSPIAAGGSWPYGQDMNGILNAITQWDRWVQAGGPMDYDATFQAAIGGYPKGAEVANPSTLGLFYLSLTDNNTTNPTTGGAGWTATGGGFPNAVGTTTASTTYTPLANGQFVNVGGSGTTQTIPSASALAGMTIGFYAATAFTLVSAGGSIIGDTLSATLVNVPTTAFITLQSDGTNWRIFSASPKLLGYGALAVGNMWTADQTYSGNIIQTNGRFVFGEDNTGGVHLLIGMNTVNQTQIGGGPNGFAISNVANAVDNFSMDDNGNAVIVGSLFTGIGPRSTGGSLVVRLADFTSSNVQDGFTILPSGMTIQWFELSLTPQVEVTGLTFPTAFATACWAITANIGTSIDPTTSIYTVGVQPNGSNPRAMFDIVLASSVAIVGTAGVWCIAVGF